MPRSCRFILALAAAVVLSPAVQADTLMIDAIESDASASKPRSGVTMDTVEQRFGAPEERIPAVGDPPISRWLYQDFTVYFEYDRVIFSVVKR